MDKFRRAILPVIVAVILLAALIYRLSSCAPGSSSAPAAGNSAKPSASASSPEATATTESPDVSASPKAPFNDKEIKTIYDGFDLVVEEIRDAGDVTIVHYDSPSGVPGEIVSRFDWFDRATGARALVFGWAYTDKFEIKADKTFTVLTTGLSYIDGGRSFPEIFTSSYTTIDGAVQFNGALVKYYAPLEKSFTVGTERRECLTDINFNGNFMSLGFGVQPGYESDFYAGSESIPKMTVINEDGFSTITLYKTIPSADFKYAGDKENSYCSLVSMTTDGTDTIIKLQLSEKVSRYNISTERSPKTDLPYAVIEYTNMGFDYPAGW